MFSPRNDEDLRAMLLHMAAASAGLPEGRQRVARWLRAALALVEGDSPESMARAALPVGTSKALEEIAAALGRASEHAEYLAEKAALMSLPRP